MSDRVRDEDETMRKLDNIIGDIEKGRSKGLRKNGRSNKKAKLKIKKDGDSKMNLELADHEQKSLLANSSMNSKSIDSERDSIKSTSKSEVMFDDSGHGDLEEEVWLDITGEKYGDLLFGRYQASSLGRIRNKRTKRILSSRISGKYIEVNISDKHFNEYTIHVHILIAATFIPVGASNVELDVDHISTDYLDNRAINLRYIDRPGNCKSYHEKKKDVYKPILQFTRNGTLVKEWMNPKHIFRDHPEYNESGINCCLNGQRKTAHGYKWERKFPKPPEHIQDDEIFEKIGMFDDCDYSMYMVSNYGQIWSLYKNKLMKLHESSGYLNVGLVDATTGDNYTERTHRLVAFVFVEGRTTTRNVVNHIDEDRKNNHCDNLEWVTQKENVEHSCAIKVNQIDPDTKQIINTFRSIADARRYLGLSKIKVTGRISTVCLGKQSMFYGFIWEYANENQEVTENPTALETLKSKPNEVWKDVKGFEKSYEISNQGRIRSKRYQTILTPYVHCGRYTVKLHDNYREAIYAVGRLTAIHFIDNPNGFRCVMHKDGDPLNYSLDNLYWSKDGRPSMVKSDKS